MKAKKPWWQQTGYRIAIGLIFLILLGGAVGGVYLTQSPPEQPIQFPHKTHVGIGAPCAFCHTGVQWGPNAGLPTISKCWGCHQQVQKKTPDLDKLAGYVERNEPIPWVPVAIMPEYVRFNHQPHLNSGLECQECHGDISQMTVAEPQRGMNMGWCLSCHQKQDPEKWTKLSDCATCHY